MRWRGACAWGALIAGLLLASRASAGTAAPPPCIENQRAHALKQAQEMLAREGAGGETQASNFSSYPLVDVDGDGQPEELLLEEYMGTANNPHFLYLSNRGCRRFGGVIWAHAESIQRLPGKKNGLRMLRVFLDDGCAGQEGTVADLGWTGDQFAIVRRIKCACPDGPSKARRRRDPACP